MDTPLRAERTEAPRSLQSLNRLAALLHERCGHSGRTGLGTDDDGCDDLTSRRIVRQSAEFAREEQMPGADEARAKAPGAAPGSRRPVRCSAIR